MINPQEIRIGNYIYGRNGICFKVLPEDIETISKFPNNYNPIPLTEEWLLRLGFERTQKDWTDDSYYAIDYWHLKGFFLSPDFMYNKIKVSWVHQLQNLVFALEGVELVTL